MSAAGYCVRAVGSDWPVFLLILHQQSGVVIQSPQTILFADDADVSVRVFLSPSQRSTKVVGRLLLPSGQCAPLCAPGEKDNVTAVLDDFFCYCRRLRRWRSSQF